MEKRMRGGVACPPLSEQEKKNGCPEKKNIEKQNGES